MSTNRRFWCKGLLAILLLMPLAALGQDAQEPGSAPEPDSAAGSPQTPDAAPTESTAPPSREAELALKQSNLSDKYARLEKLLFDLSALEAGENPARAALLRRAYQQSADQLTKKQMDAVVELISRSELRRATQEQQEVMKDLKTLLELLLSEDRPERLKNEQQRIREYIRQVEDILRRQIDLHGQNEAGRDPKDLAGKQGKVSDRTKALAEKIRENEEQGTEQQNGESSDDQSNDANEGETKPADDQQPEGSESKPSEAKPMDGESGEQKPNEGDKEDSEAKPPMPDESAENKPPEQEPSEQEPSEQKPSDQQPSSEQQPSEQQPSDSQQSQNQDSQESKPSDQQQQQQQGTPQQGEQQPSDQNQDPNQAQNQQQQQRMENPARKQLEEAFKRMREAQQRLEEAKRKESLEQQEQAEAELLKTKALLEEILRQLREEEVGRTLELLESRFRKMLDLELRVYESTKRLDQVAETERERDFAIQANNLSADQRKIALEADKALMLLEEEGSSLSFPEAVEQMRDEMYVVAERLASLKVSFVTQESEEAIISELEELIAALQQAQQELDQKKQQQDQQQMQAMEPGEQPLVDKLAELKMIRALQMRVNTRTQRFARLLADIEDPVGQVTDAELREHVQQLAERELRIHELTRDLILGKNK